MVFTILCEELGFIGAAFAILLFLFLIFRGYALSLRLRDTYARLLGLGISTKMAIQTLLNIAVVTNTIPNTGISLPFFSYGGSSLVMLFFEMGIMLSLSKKINI
jgi:cell division protein FtsW